MTLLMVLAYIPMANLFSDMSTYSDNIEVYLFVGCLVGTLACFLTAFGVIVCLRRHKRIVTGEIIAVDKLAGVERACVHTQDSHTASHNTYVKGTDTAPPASSACPQRNEPQTSQQRRVSIASDYTESHYYTEIDEYFINKRIAKKQKKNCYEKTSFEEDTPAPESKINIDGNVYDYAYGMRPPK